MVYVKKANRKRSSKLRVYWSYIRLRVLNTGKSIKWARKEHKKIKKQRDKADKLGKELPDFPEVESP